MKKILAFLILSAACFGQTVVTGAPGSCTVYDSGPLTANLAATTVLTSASAGFYSVNAYEVETTAAGTSSTMPNLNLKWTDGDTSIVQTFGYISGSTANVAGTVGLRSNNPPVIYVAAGSVIQLLTATSYASSPAGMTYRIRAKVCQL